MSEIDKLRLLASELLRHNIEMQEAALRRELTTNPARILLPINET